MQFKNKDEHVKYEWLMDVLEEEFFKEKDSSDYTIKTFINWLADNGEFLKILDITYANALGWIYYFTGGKFFTSEELNNVIN